MIRAAWPLTLALVAALLLTACGTAASKTDSKPPSVSVHAIASGVPTLRGAVALGTLVALDPRADVAEFRIRCGWYAARGKPTDAQATMPKGKLHAGLWKVALRGFAFNVETYPNGPASGIANATALKAWERYVTRRGWRGTLFLPSGWREPFLSDGPATDVCGGVLG